MKIMPLKMSSDSLLELRRVMGNSFPHRVPLLGTLSDPIKGELAFDRELSKFLEKKVWSSGELEDFK